MRLALLLAVWLALPLPARAADPVECGVFARDFTVQVQKYFWSRAYNYCLVRDLVPPLPRDFESEMAVVLPDATPIAIARPDISKIGVVPATDRPPRAPEASAKGIAQPASLSVPARPVGAPATSDSGSIYRSKNGSLHDAAWAARCARTHPQGWDARTGTITVLKGRRWTRVPCPG